eukprot:CAMPEP_0172311580 /NCGR_PEP_ID=MMETSP1058-20130122/15184_1 /TAXON_ID=83371 /ORGANISM="Detonula confervacea, Strain CCMP 353" /LENGTH=838 /DNA_ID=CAMNT_0013024809 /DNA_START=208 /DNA_END=2724 /DNA_ORIENTATION=-
MHFQPHPKYPQGHPSAIAAHYGASSSSHRSPHSNSASQYPQPQHGGGGGRGDFGGPYGPYNDVLPNSYSNESRNYTDSQLGVMGGGALASAGPPGNMAQQQQFASPPPPSNYRPPPASHQPLQQQYSTPRMPRHATVLKDRGSTENSVGSDPSGGSENMGYGYHGNTRGNHAKASSSPALKGNHRVGSHGKKLNKAGSRAPSGAKAQPKEMRSPDGRHTPVRDRNMEGQVLFATPNQRREVPSTPSSVYSEPPRRKPGNRPQHPTMSPNYNRMRSPDPHAGNYSRGGNGGNNSSAYHNKNQLNKHQSKLPHGLTVQELKEMTRARLAAEGEIRGPEGSSDQSVHSAGTQASSSKGSDQFSLGRGSNLAQSSESVTRNLVQSNESIRHDYSNQGLSSQSFQGQQQQQLQQMQQQQNQPQFNNYPRYASPVFGAAPQNQFNGNQPPPVVPRQLSPAFCMSSSRETASVASSTLASEYQVPPAESAYHAGPSPISDSNAMTFNRGRCFSAGANTGIPSSSFEQHHQAYAYYDNVPLTGTANRQRCATASPPGMSRLHEDRPFLYSTDDKERLAIPPLSEPRLRLHSTGGINTHGTALRAFNPSMSPTPNNNVGSGSAFIPIGKSNEQFMPQSPPPMSVDRSKFGVGDRTLSSGSATSGHGDLPSSMAEAVLESITSTAGAPMGVIGAASPFRSAEQEMIGESPFRVSDKSDNTSSAFRLDGLLPESSGSASLFSSVESGNIFSTENSRERMLLGTHSWGGGEDETAHSHMGLSHDFSNLLNLSGSNHGPALRGRAATEPVWFGGNDPLLVSRIDPEHNAETKGPPRVSSLVALFGRKPEGH